MIQRFKNSDLFFEAKTALEKYGIPSDGAEGLLRIIWESGFSEGFEAASPKQSKTKRSDPHYSKVAGFIFGKP